MRSWSALLAAAALALAGCEGTEVGNPEVKVNVSASLFAYDSTATVSLASMPFRFVRMDYTYADSGSDPESGTCWNRPGGILVDFASDSASGLPDTSVRGGNWSRSEIALRVSNEGSSRLPDSADWRTWSSPRYAKFYLIRNPFGNPDSLRAVFEMPQGMEIRLVYSKDQMVWWLWGDTMWVSVEFRTGSWAGNLGPWGSWKMRKDGKLKPYVLFSPIENAQTWNELKARLPAAFDADSVRVR
jgi:hypothetical protein